VSNNSVDLQLVTDALEAARLEVVSRMVSKGIPRSIRVERSVVIPNADGEGWKSHSEEVEASSLFDLTLARQIADDTIPSTQLGLKDQLLPLAQELSDSSDLGQPRSGLIYPMAEGVEAVLIRVCSPMANYYLRQLQDLERPDLGLAA
jgi:hypothetical protein